MISVIRRALAVTAAALLVVAMGPAAPAAASAVTVDPGVLAGICGLFRGEMSVGGPGSDYGCTIAEGQFRCEAATWSCGFWPLPPVPDPLAGPCGRASGVYAVAASEATCRWDSGTVAVHSPPEDGDPDDLPSRFDLGWVENEPPKKRD